MGYNWLRLYKDVRNDHKLQTMPPELFRQLINLWTLALEGEPYGRLPATPEEVGWVLRKSEKEASRILAELRALGLLDEDEATGLLVPHNWDARQYISDHNGAQRVAAFRERQKELGLLTEASKKVHSNGIANVSSNVTSNVSRNGPDTDTDTDTELDLLLSPNLSTKVLNRKGLRGDVGGPASAASPTPPAAPSKERTGNKTPKKGTAIPENFRATILVDANIAWALSYLEGATRDEILDITENFIERCQAQGTVYKNWLAAWKYWVRNEKKYGKGKSYATNRREGWGTPGTPGATNVRGNSNQLAGKYESVLLGGSVPPAKGDSPS